mmetsp:Transcript_14093/g.51172  ORF Transcript_14093/g.51172 Transcript_14093/m.51172 type:complete len:209 (-) Transcript_14093:912-1538(-)
MAESRCALERSEWITSTLRLSNISSLYSCFARSFDSTKIRTGGRIPCRSSDRRVCSLVSSVPANTKRCSTSTDAASVAPTKTRKGAGITLRASSSTFSGSVALKSAFCKSGCVQLATMASICSSMSSPISLSASSRKRKRTLPKTSLSADSIPHNRCGVATRICGGHETIPSNVAFVRRPTRSLRGTRLLISRLICFASSRVGLTTTA